MCPSDTAASPSPTIQCNTNHTMSVIAAAASARSPVLPGAFPPTLPPQSDAAHVHQTGTDGARHEEATSNERTDDAEGGVSVGVDEQNFGGYDLDEEVEDGAGEMDAAAAEFTFARRTMHFLRGERISTVTRPVVELAILMEAGIHITALGPLKNEDKWPRMRARYVRAVSEFSPEDFQSLGIRDKMKTQIYRAQGSLDGKRLWEKYGEIRCEIRTMTSKFPPNLSSMPSGKQLHDVYEKYIIERYRALYVSTSCLCVTISFTDKLPHPFVSAFHVSLTK